ncbi:unnamed protein product, partial [marine sediment metagenome]
KVKQEELFTIIGGFDSSDIWKLNEIPAVYVEEYNEMLKEWASKKEITIKEVADNVSELKGEELEKYIENLSEITGKKLEIQGNGHILHQVPRIASKAYHPRANSGL